jgi:hypothetical protein
VFTSARLRVTLLLLPVAIAPLLINANPALASAPSDGPTGVKFQVSRDAENGGTKAFYTFRFNEVSGSQAYAIRVFAAHESNGVLVRDGVEESFNVPSRPSKQIHSEGRNFTNLTSKNATGRTFLFSVRTTSMSQYTSARSTFSNSHNGGIFTAYNLCTFVGRGLINTALLGEFTASSVNKIAQYVPSSDPAIKYFKARVQAGESAFQGLRWLRVQSGGSYTYDLYVNKARAQRVGYDSMQNWFRAAESAHVEVANNCAHLQ